MISRKKLIIYNWLSALMPDFGLFKRLRKVLLRWSGVVIPSSVSLSGTVRFAGDGDIIIGDNCIIRDGCFFNVTGRGRIELGNNVKIGENVILECLSNPKSPSSLVFGNHVDFMMCSLASANGNAHVRIGNNCKIAHNVSIKATEHHIVTGGECIAGDTNFRDITISDGCWICAGAIITPGVTIGKYNVIGAGAVVIKSSPDNALLAGVPAIIKKHYFFKGHSSMTMQ